MGSNGWTCVPPDAAPPVTCPKNVYFLLAHGGVPYVSGPTRANVPGGSGCTLKFPHDTTQENLTLLAHPGLFSAVCKENRPAVTVPPGESYHNINVGFEPIRDVRAGIYDCCGVLLYDLSGGISGDATPCRLEDIVQFMIGKHTERRAADPGLPADFDLWVMSCSIAVGKSTIHPTRRVYGDVLGNQALGGSEDPDENQAAAGHILYGPCFQDLRDGKRVAVRYIPGPRGPGEASGSGGPKGPGGRRRRTYKKRKNGKKRRQSKRRI